MKTVVQSVKIGIFMGMLVLPSVIWYGTKFLAPDVYEKWDYDLGENRAKAEFPDEFDLENYTGQLEAYYNDHLPFRSGLITAKQSLSGRLEKVYDQYLQKGLARLLYGGSGDTYMDLSGLSAKKDMNAETETESAPIPADSSKKGHDYICAEEIPAACLEEGKKTYICRECGDSYSEVIPPTGHDYAAVFTQEADYLTYGYTDYMCSVCGETYRGDFVGKVIDNSHLAPKIVGGKVILGRFDWLFYSGDNSISYYKGTNIMEEDEMAAYLERMIRLQELCDQREIQLQFMITPNKEQVYPEYMPSYEIADTYKREERFVDYVRENSNVSIIYPIRELKEAELYWQTYLRYDTHWNYLGAYVGTQALYEALGMPVSDLHDWEIAEYNISVGDLFLMGGLDASAYPEDKDYFVDYKPEISLTETEGSIMEPVYRTSSESENRQKLVFLGDSFRERMAGYLVKDFSDTVIVHRENIEEVKEEIRDADILVIEAVERLDAEILPAIETAIEILEEE